MAEEPDGVRRNVKIAVRKSVSEWSEEGESECREVSCRLHRGREKSQSYLTQQHWNRQTRDDTKTQTRCPSTFFVCLDEWTTLLQDDCRRRLLTARLPVLTWVSVCCRDLAREGFVCAERTPGAQLKRKKRGTWGGTKSKKSRCYSLTPIFVIWPSVLHRGSGFTGIRMWWKMKTLQEECLCPAAWLCSFAKRSNNYSRFSGVFFHFFIVLSSSSSSSPHCFKSSAHTEQDRR